MELPYYNQLKKILEAGYTFVSDVKPSEWTEANMVMQDPFPGPYRYAKTPYAKEIIDCLANDHSCHTLALMKGAQIGMSSGVIIPGIGWIIQNNPGNTYLSVGAPDLIEKAMEKLDLMIDSTGIRKLIKPQINRARNNKSGDTNTKKEFPNGYVSIGSANNHKNLIQVDLRFVFLDDYEKLKKASKESGDTISKIKQRQAAYYGKSKLFLVSTPEVKETSNIEPAYLLGDQRKYMIPCPCCGVPIEWKWSYQLEDTKEVVGVYWELDAKNQLIPESVGYKCQECKQIFNDKNKNELLNLGKWVATAAPSEEGYYSYHISSLYAPLGMYDWLYYVKLYLQAVPPEGQRDEDKLKQFMNEVLGLTYEEEAESLDASSIERNKRDYEIGIIPEKLSLEDGNGRIVLLTCACDLNGTLDDARLDYEVVAWSENGSTYSVTHGSIGTFIPNQNKQQKEKDNREKWTYQHGKPNTVWEPFNDMLQKGWQVDTGRTIGIFATGIDTGHCEKEAFEYIDSANVVVYGLKGDKEDKYLPFSQDFKMIKDSLSRPGSLYMVLGGKIKDNLSRLLKLKWDKYKDESQPAGFCNFPESANGLYKKENFFSHFESEIRKIEKKKGEDVSARWVKKSPTAQNHLWDCRVYNIAIKEILMRNVFKEIDLKNGVWRDFVSVLNGTYRPS